MLSRRALVYSTRVYAKKSAKKRLIHASTKLGDVGDAATTSSVTNPSPTTTSATTRMIEQRKVNQAINSTWNKFESVRLDQPNLSKNASFVENHFVEPTLRNPAASLKDRPLPFRDWLNKSGSKSVKPTFTQRKPVPADLKTRIISSVTEPRVEWKTEYQMKWERHKKDRHADVAPKVAAVGKLEGKKPRQSSDGSGEKLEFKEPKRKSVNPVPTKAQDKQVYIPEVLSVSNLAQLLGVRLETLQRRLKKIGLPNTHNHLLSADDASLAVLEYGLNPVINNAASLDLYPVSPLEFDPSHLKNRPPVVTIMGHVDHGKTTLLDVLRKTSVAASEAGGITQHIGAFSVQLPSKEKITFLDTPGHAAFSAMRARGAQVTDIVVLVVAADDGVMPQTLEAIKHANEANVPMIVAMTKCDKPNIDTNKVKLDLLANGVQLEDFGGDTQLVEVSAVKQTGLIELEESILALAETMEIKSNHHIKTEATVIESQVDKGLGNVATILVRHGVLHTGDFLIGGSTWCRVRLMINDQGKQVKEVSPGTPVKITGWKELPKAGDLVLQAENEAQAKNVVENRLLRENSVKNLESLEELNEKRRLQRQAHEQEKNPSTTSIEVNDEEVCKIPELPIVVKADVSGTVEAVVAALEGLPSQKVRARIVHASAGTITESDLAIAAASPGSVVIGFNVSLKDKKLIAQARSMSISVIAEPVIYRLLDNVKAKMKSLLPPVYRKQVTGEAKILQIFEISAKGGVKAVIAGSRVINGTMKKNQQIRVIRDSQCLFEGDIESLRHLKKDVQEISKGLECGVSVKGFDQFREGDLLQTFETVLDDENQVL